MKRIDPTVGPRAGLYAHFRAFRQPMFTLGSPVRLDAAALKPRGGLFGTLLHAAMGAANDVPQLRQRIHHEDGTDVVVEHPAVHATCTAATPEGAFNFCYVPWEPDPTAFLDALPGRFESAAERPFDLSQEHRDDLLFISTVPWVPIHAVVHASSGDPHDSVPRVLWGRTEGDQVVVHLTAHHALVDGRHVARFFECMAARLDALAATQG